MVALKHKARLLLHWHHICFGLAYMAGTPQRYNAWIMFRSLTARRLDGESSSLRRTQCWAERLFVLHSPVTFLFSSGLELFIFLPFVGGWCSATTQRGSCSQGIMLDSSEAVFLSWSWPRNALILFYYHNTSNSPPSILYLYTDSSYFYTYCKTINKSQREWNWNMKEEWKF